MLRFLLHDRKESADETDNENLIYLLGTASLALGIVINTRTGYGVAAISSVPYVLSEITDISLGNFTMITSCFYVFLQILIMRRRFTPKVLLQIPYSILFGMLTDILNNMVRLEPVGHFTRALVLGMAILFMAAGVMLAVNTKYVINPADGLTQEVAVIIKKDFGFAKNLVDLSCVILTMLLSAICSGRIIGVDIGTVVCAVFIGRTISFFNWRFQDKVQRITGVKEGMERKQVSEVQG